MATRVLLLLFAFLFLRVSPLPQGHFTFGFLPFRPARQAIQTDDQCRTPAGNRGQCVVWTECQPVLEILSSTNRRVPIHEYLQRISCGFVGVEPKVCCTAGKLILAPAVAQKLPSSTEVKQTTATATATATTTIKPSTSKAILPKSCGFGKYAERRIVGGTEALPGAWPWMAVLLYRNNVTNKVSHQCDGVLITDRHVLTAAHCLDSRSQLYRVRLGDHQTDTANESAHQDVQIEKVIRHEGYNRTIISNDVALIKLKKTINFTESIRPICLPRDAFFSDSSNFVRETAVVAGWGRTSEGGNSSKVLRQVNLVVVSATSCRDSYSDVFNVRVTDDVVCAARVSGSRASGFCQGDSGGPLMVSHGVEDRFYLLGIVSHAVGCARASFPGIYVNVPRYMSWIMRKLAL